MLSKIARPSLTALTIDAKLSSVKIISAASFATSVPVIPIAIPMFAFFKAGASLTPSPVTATISPNSWRRETIRYFWSGAIRAKIISPFKYSFKVSSSILLSSGPEITRGSLSFTMPILLAIAKAVKE